eukprot:2260748-Rhodomonas_salina.1
MQETAISVQFVLEMRFLVCGFAVVGGFTHSGTSQNCEGASEDMDHCTMMCCIQLVKHAGRNEARNCKRSLGEIAQVEAVLACRGCK